jgi:tetratricopeptide (TPR) repeat protein
MKWLNLYIKHRLWLGIVLLALAIFTNIQAGFWPSFILYLLAVISIVGHFVIGPMRLVQTYMEEGDIEGAKGVLNGIKFPGLLIKPVRSAYYTVKGHLDMANQDFAAAEKNLKKSNELMSNSTLMQGQMKQAEGANMLQLGMLAIQKGQLKQGESYIRQAIRTGLADNESKAMAYLQLCSIMMNKREFRASKEYFRKAKGFKPTTPQLVDQIKQLEKTIVRLPG